MITELRLEANYLALRDLGAWLQSLVADCETNELGAIELGVHELATNCVDHAQPSDGVITFSGTVDGSLLRITMCDRGIEFDAGKVTASHPDQPQVRGYGLMILEQLAHELVYERQGDENIWRAAFPLYAAQ